MVSGVNCLSVSIHNILDNYLIQSKLVFSDTDDSSPSLQRPNLFYQPDWTGFSRFCPNDEHYEHDKNVFIKVIKNCQFYSTKSKFWNHVKIKNNLTQFFLSFDVIWKGSCSKKKKKKKKNNGLSLFQHLPTSKDKFQCVSSIEIIVKPRERKFGWAGLGHFWKNTSTAV